MLPFLSRSIPKIPPLFSSSSPIDILPINKKSQHFQVDDEFKRKYETGNYNFENLVTKTSKGKIIRALLISGTIGFTVSYFGGYFRDYSEPGYPLWLVCTLLPIPWAVGALRQRSIQLRYFPFVIPALLLGQHLGGSTFQSSPYYWHLSLERHLEKTYPDTYIAPPPVHWMNNILPPIDTNTETGGVRGKKA